MDTPCIEHPGPYNSSGYASCRYEGVRVGAHVKAYIEKHGPVPKGMVVMHSCHNRKCINDEHLSVGTQSQNILDAVEAGRMPQLFNKEYCKGSKNKCSKLTEEDVRQIKLAQTEYKYGQDSKLARIYGVTTRVIRLIRVGEAWTSVSLD